MRNYLFSPLGVPIGMPIKRDTSDWLAGASLLNASINNSIQAQSDYKARQQASEFFYRNLEEQWRALREQEWYNSPLNQRQMLERAGYSPYSMFGYSSSLNGSVGSSTQPHNTLPQFDNTGFSVAAQIMNNTKLADAQAANLAQQTAGLTIDNFSKDARNQAEINDLLESANLKGADAFGKNLSALVAQNSFDSLVAANRENVNLIKSQIEKNVADRFYTNSLKIKTDKETDWIDDINRNYIANLAAQTATQASIQSMNYEYARFMVANRIFVEAKKQGQDITNMQAWKMSGALVDQQTYKALQEEIKANNLSEFGSSEVTHYEEIENTAPFQKWLGGHRERSNVPSRVSRSSGKKEYIYRGPTNFK